MEVISEFKGGLTMLQSNFQNVYDKFKLEFFRRIF